MTTSFAFVAPPAAATHLDDCLKQVVPCATQPCYSGSSCHGFDECSAWQVDWDYCEGYLICAWAQDVGHACVVEPTGCPRFECVGPIDVPPWTPACADGVPGHACWGDDLVCVQLSPTSIPVCARDPCAPNGCVTIETLPPPEPYACVMGVTHAQCALDGDACVGLTGTERPLCTHRLQASGAPALP